MNKFTDDVSKYVIIEGIDYENLGLKTQFFSCVLIEKIPTDKQIKLEVEDKIIYFCDWDCFMSNIGKLIANGYANQ